MCPGALARLSSSDFLDQRMGLSMQPLPVAPTVVERLRHTVVLELILATSGCSCRFLGTQVLLSGSLEGRWKAMQQLKLVAQAMEEKRHPKMPRELLGDATVAAWCRIDVGR